MIWWSLCIACLCFLPAEGIVGSTKVVNHYSAVVSTELNCNVSDHLHKPATAATAAVTASDMLAPEYSKYENLPAAHTISSLPTYLLVLDPEVLCNLVSKSIPIGES